MMHSTHFIYNYMVKDIHIVREEIYCSHYMGYSFSLAAKYILYAPSNKQDNPLCGVLAKMRNSSMGSPRRIDPLYHE